MLVYLENSIISGKNTPSFAKDTVYRFMKMVHINWIRFTTLLAARIINNAIVPLDSEERVNALTIDDSMFEHCRSKKVELLAKVYDHARRAYKLGFRMLHSAGQMGAPLSRSTVSCCLRKTGKTALTMLPVLIKGASVISAVSFPWKKGQLQC